MSKSPYLCALAEVHGEEGVSQDDLEDKKRSWGWMVGAGRDCSVAEM